MSASDLAGGWNPTEKWSTPVSAPLVPAFPIQYRQVHVLTAVYRTDRLAIRAQLPLELEPISDHVMVHLYVMPDVQGMGRVTECNVMVGARLVSDPAVAGGFTVGLYISSDAGLAQGREVHGQPKKLGRVRVSTCGDLVVGTVRRNGIRIVRVTTPYKVHKAPLDDLQRYFAFKRNLNVKVIPSIEGGQALCQITERQLHEVEVHECWSGPATVELLPNAQAPVHQLPVLEAIEAFDWSADFSLKEGRVVADLLQEGRIRA